MLSPVITLYLSIAFIAYGMYPVTVAFVQGKLILWRCVFVTHLLVILVLGSVAWGMSEGLSLDRRRAEAFNVLVFGEIGYAITTRFIKASTFHTRY